MTVTLIPVYTISPQTDNIYNRGANEELNLENLMFRTVFGQILTGYMSVTGKMEGFKYLIMQATLLRLSVVFTDQQIFIEINKETCL